MPVLHQHRAKDKRDNFMGLAYLLMHFADILLKHCDFPVLGLQFILEYRICLAVENGRGIPRPCLLVISRETNVSIMTHQELANLFVYGVEFFSQLLDLFSLCMAGSDLFTGLLVTVLRFLLAK